MRAQPIVALHMQLPARRQAQLGGACAMSVQNLRFSTSTLAGKLPDFNDSASAYSSRCALGSGALHTSCALAQRANAQALRPCRSTLEIARAAMVFELCRWGWLVRNSEALLRLARRLRHTVGQVSRERRERPVGRRFLARSTQTTHL
eukprot:SAG11_NODE_12486_length_701_cov_0.813953_1_plen_147_part_01